MTMSATRLPVHPVQTLRNAPGVAIGAIAAASAGSAVLTHRLDLSSLQRPAPRVG